MGYMVSFEFDVVVKNPKWLKKAIKDKLDQDEKFEAHWGDLYVDDGEIGLGDYYRNWNDEFSDAMFELIAPFVQGRIYLNDDEDRWCEEFDGEGQRKCLQSTTFYGFCSFKEFMKEHEKEMPEDIRRGLELWWLARKV